jgi:hypothetical protein
LGKIFSDKDVDGISYQIKFNTVYTKQEAEDKLLFWLSEIGYSKSELKNIQQASRSKEVQSSLGQQKEIVEKKIQTIKIPTIMFDGRRYDRAVEPEKLR